MNPDNPKSSSIPDTMWTMVVTPAAQGSVEALGELFTMYEAAICNLIRKFRRQLPDDEIKDLYQRFVLSCIRRDFLVNVDRSKGKFRHFLWICVRRFLMDDARRRQIPGNRNDIPIDVGGDDEDAISLPADSSEEWVALDEPWALAIEAAAIQKVREHMDRRGLEPECRASLVKRLQGQQQGEATLKEEAARIRMRPSEYNNLFYSYRAIYRGEADAQLQKQVRASDLQDEFQHFLKVLARIRSREPV